MRLTGERQTDLAAGIRISQTRISRKQSGAATWTLDDLDRLSAHYGIPVPDLVAGVDRAIQCLPAPRRRPAHHQPLTLRAVRLSSGRRVVD
ncbi:helix-turn-helix transcriptional regulator [Streptomyces microflavus]|uniref:helix-turn-helix transcriptional regulator n=1 Tax=Streptomyces microflavus TaxID=1919 RepID=UPI00343B09EE